MDFSARAGSELSENCLKIKVEIAYNHVKTHTGIVPFQPRQVITIELCL